MNMYMYMYMYILSTYTHSVIITAAATIIMTTTIVSTIGVTNDDNRNNCIGHFGILVFEYACCCVRWRNNHKMTCEKHSAFAIVIGC